MKTDRRAGKAGRGSAATTRRPAGNPNSSVVHSWSSHLRRARRGGDFIDEPWRRFPVAIQRIKTDPGSEFGSAFTWHLQDLGIAHRYIPHGSPESNGKVERSHRTDEEECSRRVRSRTLEELQTKLRTWGHEYNHLRPHLALKSTTPVERLCELRISIPHPVRQTA